LDYLETILIEPNIGPKNIGEKILVNSEFDRKFYYVIIRNAYQRAKIRFFGKTNNDEEILINLLEALQKQKS